MLGHVIVEGGAPGIAAALRALYGQTEPDFRWVTEHRWQDGGPDPLDEVRVYTRADPVPHWHYVAVGLTSTAVGTPDTRHVLDDPEDGRGWTFELTARLARTDSPEHEHPPVFMANLLQNLTRYVVETFTPFGPGHTMDLYGPIQQDSTTPVGHVLFMEDPELGRGPRGDTREAGAEAIDFLQVVGLTADEAAAKKTWTDTGFAALYEQYYPLLVTRLDRDSILTVPRALAAVEAGRAADGSSLGGLVVEQLTVTQASRLARFRRRAHLTVTLGADVVETLRVALPLRIGAGDDFSLESEHACVTFSPEAHVDPHEHEPGHWVIALTPHQAHAVAAQLLPRAGTYRAAELATVDFLVEPTTVRDHDDTPLRTIG
ncbi:suppressor of fused domain protein [Cellulomonas sp. 179-A 4D5 NHS]|uniref:suppressor of fused domain protein n=1 Tax=Cellulomonas sp. 179-A 4D5 NHS TaxID=3142378 RepID=UPI0039A2CEE1